MGEGLPDITILPALARYFGVTLDTLFGTEATSAALQAVNRRWEENNQSGRHKENAALMEEALRDDPNNALLLVQLSTSLDKLEGTEAERREYLRRSIAVQERILNYGTDPEVVNAARYNICFAYWKNGDRQKAVEQAERLLNLYKTRENALVYFLEGIAREQVSRQAVRTLTWALSLHLAALGETEKQDAVLAILGK